MSYYYWIMMQFNLLVQLGVLVAFFASISQAHDYSDKGWDSASKFLKGSMDDSHNPCRHFFGYACGSAVGGELPISDRAMDPEADLRKLLKMALGRPARAGHTQAQEPDDYKTRLRKFRDRCINKRVMTDRELLLQIQKAMHKIMEQETEEARAANITGYMGTVWHIAGFVKRKLMCPFLVNAKVDWTIVNCTKRSILKLTYAFWPGLRTSEEEMKVRDKQLYEDSPWIVSDNVSLDNSSEKTKALEADLQFLFLDEYERNSKTNSKTTGAEDGRIMKLSALINQYPSVDWHAYLVGLFGKKMAEDWKKRDLEVLLVGDEYFRLVSEVVNAHPADAVGRYIFWKLAEHMETFYKSKTSRMSNTTTREEKEIFCYDIMKELAPAAVGRLIFDSMKANISDWRTDVDLVGTNVLAAFRIFITGQDWLDSQGKMAIIRRLDNIIKIDTGIPTWLENDKEVDKKTPRFETNRSTMQNIATTYQIMFNEAFLPLLRTNEFIEPPPSLNLGAKYESGKIKLNLGQLLPPFYDIHYPLSVKYGMLGWLIGHHLMQGFDEADLRRTLVTQHGSDWFSGDRETKFQQRKACIVRQYSSYCYRDAQGECVRISELKTINQNVGDIEGIKIAYMAYKFVTQTMGPEPPLPELVKLTGDKLFFISAAQLHCKSVQKLEQYRKSEAKEKTPNNYRVEQAMRNFAVFAKTFECVKGSNYAPFRTCSLWGRFVSPS